MDAQLDRLIAAIRGTVGHVGGLLLLLAVLVALFLRPVCRTTFPRATTLQAMMFQLPELGLLSLAMAIPLISGGINLAIIATANQAALLMAWILTALMPPDDERRACSRSGSRRASLPGFALCVAHRPDRPAFWSPSSAFIRSWSRSAP